MSNKHTGGTMRKDVYECTVKSTKYDLERYEYLLIGRNCREIEGKALKIARRNGSLNKAALYLAAIKCLGTLDG